MSTEKPAKPNVLKPRLPRGFGDRGPTEIAAANRMIERIRGTYERYGFEAVETPFVELTEALGKFLPDQDRPNEGVFSFQDDDEQWLSLRYDLTAPLARYVAENFDRLPKPYRSYRSGWVFRNEKPGPGRFRQFMQFDADTVGSASVAADAEICMMAADTLEALGLKGQYIIKVNNRKILDGVMEAIGLGGEENAGRRLMVLRAIDKYDRLGAEGVRLLLTIGRKDESGDFTKGAGLDEEIANGILLLISKPEQGNTRVAIAGDEPKSYILTAKPAQDLPGLELEPAAMGRENDLGLGYIWAAIKSMGIDTRDRVASFEGFQELQQLARLVHAAGYSDRVQVDPSVVRGLEYYTGPVFEAELTFAVKDDDGRPVRFGSVGGGGRYDGLVGRFRSEPVPATGFSIGVSRLLAALQAVKSPILTDIESFGPVVVLVLDRDRIADYQKLVAALRADNIRAEMYLGSAGMKAQMKYADRRNAPCVVIQGSDEKARGEVQIKDLIEGAKAAEAIASNAEWKSVRPAQVAVPEAALVETVREILARHRG